MKNFPWLALVFILLIAQACTPKVTEPATETPTQPVTPPPATDEELSPCPKFTDAPNQDDAETWYVLYRDFLRAQDYDKAYNYWRRVYEVAPAADGRRNTVYSDGIFFYEYFMSQTQDSSYIDSIFLMYDHIEECYPEGGYVNGRRGFDLYYKYPGLAEDRKEIYDYLKASIETDGLETHDFVINPFTALLVEMYEAGEIDQAEAKHYSELIPEIIAHGVANCEGTYCERWEIVQQYAPERLEYFETVKGFYDCTYYRDKYYPDFVAHRDSCEVVTTVLSRMRWGGCTEGMPEFDEVLAVYNESCRPRATGPAALGYECLQNAEYDCAIEKFQEAADMETADMERKGTILLLIAKIYYVHKRQYGTARNFAQQAADVRSGWGEPYILIGRMYASSGPLCGPGRGWDSQVVVWPAIDMWNRAKQIDPRAAREANQWISQYAQYMPSR
ncbi:MAG: hypothetical protein KDC54_17645, partial [Lewinella sp.]|nr:hypothetical protein [Lewinella sp.]